MLCAPLDSGGRAVGPAIVLARIAEPRGGLGIFLHPAPPIGFEEGAESLRSGGLRVRVWPLRIFCCSEKYERRGEHREYCEHANHYGFLPAAVASSFSRSRASMTMRRAVSAASMAVLSTRRASAARTSGETLRSRSRLSRSRTSSRTCAGVIGSPFS